MYVTVVEIGRPESAAPDQAWKPAALAVMRSVHHAWSYASWLNMTQHR